MVLTRKPGHLLALSALLYVTLDSITPETEKRLAMNLVQLYCKYNFRK